MPRITLTLPEIDELISAYKSSLKKLKFQVDRTTETLRELQSLRELKKERMTPPAAREKSPEASGLEEEKKKVAKKVSDKKPKRKRKSTRSEGYKLSEWDEAIIEIIRSNQKPMSSADLIQAAMAHEAAAGAQADEAFVKGKVARSLQKLANKRGTLRKHPTRGKGFAYGLGEWFFSKTGKLKKSYQ